MANAIVSVPPTKAVASQYHFPEAHRRILLAQADNPTGKITRSMLLEVEQKRLIFIQLHGNEFGL